VQRFLLKRLESCEASSGGIDLQSSSRTSEEVMPLRLQGTPQVCAQGDEFFGRTTHHFVEFN
jgi:hypothetical protein